MQYRFSNVTKIENVIIKYIATKSNIGTPGA